MWANPRLFGHSEHPKDSHHHHGKDSHHKDTSKVEDHHDDNHHDNDHHDDNHHDGDHHDGDHHEHHGTLMVGKHDVMQELVKRRVQLALSNSEKAKGSALTPEERAHIEKVFSAEPSTALDDHDDHHHADHQTVQLTFVDWNGDSTTVDARVGGSLLETAKRFWLPIPGKCDGGDRNVGDTNDFGEGASCRFCHVFLDAKYQHAVPSALNEEEFMLHHLPNRRPNSRCACQVIVTPELSGMSIGMPSYGYMSRPGEHDGGDYM